MFFPDAESSATVMVGIGTLLGALGYFWRGNSNMRSARSTAKQAMNASADLKAAQAELKTTIDIHTGILQTIKSNLSHLDKLDDMKSVIDGHTAQLDNISIQLEKLDEVKTLAVAMDYLKDSVKNTVPREVLESRFERVEEDIKTLRASAAPKQ